MPLKRIRTLSVASLLVLAPVVCLSQTPEVATSQEVLDELKGVRASLARLVEIVERGQKVQWTLFRIQIDQSQVAALEARRSNLSAREQHLTKEVAVLSAVPDEESGSATSPTGEHEAVVSSDAWSASDSLSQASEALDEVQGEVQTVEQEIARLRKLIAANEKFVANAMR